MSTQLRRSIIMGGAVFLSTVVPVSMAQARPLHIQPMAGIVAMNIAYPTFDISARLALPLEYRCPLAAYGTPSGYAEIVCVIKNKSAHRVIVNRLPHFPSTVFDVEGAGVRALQPAYLSNSVSPVTLLPGGTFTQNVPIQLDDSVQDNQNVTCHIVFLQPEYTSSSPEGVWTVSAMSMSVTLHKLGGGVQDLPGLVGFS